jgi:hypothetical protein
LLEADRKVGRASRLPDLFQASGRPAGFLGSIGSIGSIGCLGPPDAVGDAD